MSPLVCLRFLLGDSVSEADVRLFPTIFRFDHVYYLRFLLDRGMISESYPNLQVTCIVGSSSYPMFNNRI